MKILISDKLAKEGVDILEAVDGFEVDCQFGIKADELKKIIKDYDALIIRSGTKVTEEILGSADKLRFIGRAGVGLDNVDLKAATKKGVVAMNTPAGNTTSTAEQTMSLILALSRNVPQAYSSLQAGKWERSKFGGVELYGKTIGVIGLGRIGSTVAGFAKAFGMKVFAFDPYLSQEKAAKMGVEMKAFEDIIKESDYITIHIPKSAETKNLIGEKELGMMKKTTRLINCARGGIVNEKALAEALKEGKIAGCALDVYEQEPPDMNSPLLSLPNCVTTPHLGASTSEAQINVAIEIAEVIRDALTGKGIRNAANFPSVSAEEYKVLEPYVELAKRMGLFAGQLIKGGMKDVKVTYHGVLTKHKVDPVSMSLVNGLLSPVLGETVNSVNALDVAADRGVSVQVTQSSKEEEFVNLINAQITTDEESFSLWGTLSSNNQPRIVKINQVYVEAIPQGYMLVVHNNDKPGIVGVIGSVLAEDKINIGAITLGRETPGGKAISVVNVDNEVKEKTISRMKENKDILLVKLINV